ncbi:MAG: pilus assembly PilX N-terminal domain-containing protein [Halioglobus sp.]|nr:pilus assembly PilX N-terminal domain-containing protein [Halioglobus sp.]
MLFRGDANAICPLQNKQQGVALVVALLFLVIVTLLAVTAARDSSFSLKMSGNMQDRYAAINAADEAAFAAGRDDPYLNDPVLTSIAGPTDPPIDPFAGVTDDPLDNVADPDAIEVTMRSLNCNRVCPPSSGAAEDTFSSGINDPAAPSCDRYHLDAQYDRPQRARTRVSVGFVWPRPQF